jgi:hypothetical protein
MLAIRISTFVPTSTRERETTMTLFSANDSVQPACTNNVHRPMGDIAGLREVHDDVGRLTVSAFPFARRRSRVHHIPSRVRDDARPPLFLERDGRSKITDLGLR